MKLSIPPLISSTISIRTRKYSFQGLWAVSGETPGIPVSDVGWTTLDHLFILLYSSYTHFLNSSYAGLTRDYDY
ncbi:MAG: hypothetical protein WD356_08840 [Pseudomonadales bacterium]